MVSNGIVPIDIRLWIPLTWTEADRTAFASIRAAVQPGAKKAINHNMTLQEVLAQEVGRHGA